MAPAGNAPAVRDQVAAAAATPPEAAPSIGQVLERNKQQIARALPNSIDAERFTRIVLTTVRTNPQLAKCDHMSILAATMLSAQLGLEPGPLGHAYLVPFKNNRTGGYEATFIVGYKGLIDLARRSGHIESIEAREVCEHDEFDYAYGLEPKLHHKPDLTDRGRPIAYYGVAKFKDGGFYFLVMSLEDINKRRQRSKASERGPWVTDFDAMARKTVIRAMAPFLPLSVEYQKAATFDGVSVPPVELATDMGDVIDVTAVDDETDDGEPEATVEPTGSNESESKVPDEPKAD